MKIRYVPWDKVVDAWDKENEATDAVEHGFEVVPTDPDIVAPRNGSIFDEDAGAPPDDTGCEFLSIIATGDGEDPELWMPLTGEE